MSTLTDEILRRRPFAIISHPDAGKTTLTEKLLLFGGAIARATTRSLRDAILATLELSSSHAIYPDSPGR